MKKMILILDESGAKGYSDNVESIPGELGVMIGYLVSNDSIDSVKSELDKIRASYFSQGKIHITDLPPEKQEAIRKDVFDVFRKRKIPWVYEAIYVQGYNKSNNLVNNISREAYLSQCSKIKVAWKEHKELLHEELFQGVFGKAVAICIDCFGVDKTQIDVITDRIDKAILERFGNSATKLLEFREDKKMAVKGFDKTAKKIVEGSIAIKITAPDEVILDLSGISFSIKSEDSSLTLAADVLANSVNHHLKGLQHNKPGIDLNDKSAIKSHPLSNLVYGVSDEKECRNFTDAVFMHPAKMDDVDKG